MEAFQGPALVAGETCRLSGLYRARCHSALLLELDEGAVFPPCKGGGCEHTAVWLYVCSP
ncbi:MAG: hypothetical protein OXF76_06525 [Caldilineaceae bacterium]|nr:hypothetical protein [Caldilineaceae bacterium]